MFLITWSNENILVMTKGSGIKRWKLKSSVFGSFFLVVLKENKNSPSMCMKSNLATLRWRKCSCSSRMAVRIIADSLAMTARSSEAVLQARTLRIRSLSFIDMTEASQRLSREWKVDLYRTLRQETPINRSWQLGFCAISALSPCEMIPCRFHAVFVSSTGQNIWCDCDSPCV